MHGVTTLEAEVTHVSAHGFWLFLGDEELPVPYAQFPWFKKATIEQSRIDIRIRRLCLGNAGDAKALARDL